MLVVVVATSFVRALLVQLGRDPAICTDDRPSFSEQKFGLWDFAVHMRRRAGKLRIAVASGIPGLAAPSSFYS